MNKYHKLAKNTGIFFIANFGSKVLTFLLVRFYTELLSTEQYGVIDLFNTTVSLAFPIVTLCITEAVLRFSIDDRENRGKILSYGLAVAMIGNLLFVLTAPLFYHLQEFREHLLWIYLLTLSNSLFAIVSHFSRGIGKSKLFAASGLFHTFFQIALNIIFLAVFRWGITGYLAASVLANVLSGMIVFIWGRLGTYLAWNVDRKYLKAMLVYAFPLIPNAVFWWIMQSADRYVITYMLSSAENGLYAVANKIPTLITTISSIFFQAWQISSVEEAGSEQKSKFYSNVFDALSVLLTICCSGILLFLQPVYRILTEKSFYIGWKSTPFLLCAMVFSCYSSFLGTNYVAMKETKGVFLTTVCGAVINLALNIALTPILGTRGTAFATLVAFLITWIARSVGTRRFVKIQYSVSGFWIPTALLLTQACVLTFVSDSMIVQAVFLILILALYGRKIGSYAGLLVQNLKQIRGKVTEK